MITFFDIPSKILGSAWSSNTWKTRLNLNFKGIPYKTEWVEYPDIAAVLQKHNIGPTKIYPDGTPYYSVPAIIDIDDRTGEAKAALAESFDIAKYLDQAFPDTPKVLTGDSAETLEKFGDELMQSMFPIFLPVFYACLMILNEKSRDHYSRARAKDVYAVYHTETLEDIPFSAEQRAAAWVGVEQSFDNLDSKFGGDDEEKPWYLGEEITWADFVIGAFLIAVKGVFGETSSEWTDIKRWNGGRWGRYIDRLGPYRGIGD